MLNVNVNTTPSYEVVFGELSKLNEAFVGLLSAKRVLIVTDDNVRKLYFDEVKKALSKDFEVYACVINAGEKYKTPETYLKVIESAENNRLTRNDAIVALGGGVVGDIAGFVAATYMRGIDYVQIPTTLLADIDSSVGGKTGVDLPSGKNLLGAFYQPKKVIVSVETLKTLTDIDWKNGIGEGIKYAVLKGGRILDILESGLDDNNIKEFISLCVQYKAEIIEKDPTEKNVRRLLNLGHTFGHAIEKQSDYKISHGIAVCKGLKIILEISRKKYGLSKKEKERVLALMKKYDIDPMNDFPFEDMKKIMSMDKKTDRNGLNIAVVKKIGCCSIENTDLEELEKLWK